ncbi:hypothetical protein NHU87_14315 [Pseudomonas mandelii]|nr:hypothetical protein [Pseudomonas mandelii]
MSRNAIALSVCLFCSTASAQQMPGADQYLAYEAAMTAMEQSALALQSIMGDKTVDKEKGRAAFAELSNDRDKVEQHLTQAIAEGNAAAIYMKARMVQGGTWSDSDPSKNRETACGLYGEAAQKGLVAGAVAYLNCQKSFPPSPMLEPSQILLRNVLEGQDVYQDAYPLPIDHGFCFEARLKPIEPGEDPAEKLRQLGQPVMLTAGQFRAEGFYRLAAGSLAEKQGQTESDLRSAYEAGCETDGLRMRSATKSSKG